MDARVLLSGMTTRADFSFLAKMSSSESQKQLTAGFIREPSQFEMAQLFSIHTA